MRYRLCPAIASLCLCRKKHRKMHSAYFRGKATTRKRWASEFPEAPQTVRNCENLVGFGQISLPTLFGGSSDVDWYSTIMTLVRRQNIGVHHALSLTFYRSVCLHFCIIACLRLPHFRNCGISAYLHVCMFAHPHLPMWHLRRKKGTGLDTFIYSELSALCNNPQHL